MPCVCIQIWPLPEFCFSFLQPSSIDVYCNAQRPLDLKTYGGSNLVSHLWKCFPKIIEEIFPVETITSFLLTICDTFWVKVFVCAADTGSLASWQHWETGNCYLMQTEMNTLWMGSILDSNEAHQRPPEHTFFFIFYRTLWFHISDCSK